MPEIQTYYGPGSASTVTPTGPGPGGPSDLENFYRELLRRKSMAGPQAYGGAPAGGGSYTNGPRRDAGNYRPEESALDVAKRNDAMQELAYRRRLREIDLSPPKKFIESRPGIIGGYADDVTMLPLSLRPQNAAIGYGPQDEARSAGRFNNDQQYQAQIAADRARSRSTVGY